MEDRCLLSVGRLYVDVDAAGTGSGDSWTNAHTDLQAALTASIALNGDADPGNDVAEIWIAEGTYRPTEQSVADTPRTETFQLLDGLSLRGGFNGTEAAADDRGRATDGRFLVETILSGDLLANDDPADPATYDDNAYTVVLGKGLSQGATLDGFTITGGRADSSSYPTGHSERGLGGGVFIYNSTLAVTNSTISHNSAVVGGGGIASGSSTLTVTNSTVSDNSATEYGGGVYGYNGTLTVTNCTLAGNSANSRGGGIAASASTLTLSDSTVSDNLATYNGGGVLSSNDSTSTVTNSTVSGNSAGRLGGGIYSLSSDLTVTDSTFSDNSANEKGGGICGSASTLTVTNSTLAANSSGYDGGGMFISAETSTLTLTNSTLEANSASNSGGGIYNSSGTLTLTDSTLEANSATGTYGYGGGISNDDGTLTLTNSTLEGNSAGNCGGGIHNSSGTLTLTNSTLAGNSATGSYSAGGGIYNRGTLTLTNSTLTGNSASSRGGGICHWRGTSTLTNSTLAGNSALWTDGSHGGIYTASGTLTLTNSIVALNQGSNSAPIGGSHTNESSLVGVDPGFVRNPSDGGDGWADDPATTDVDESANNDYGDLRLTASSIAIDMGDTSLLPADTFDLDNDQDTSEPIPVDQDRNARVVGGTVDLGAFEFQGSPAGAESRSTVVTTLADQVDWTDGLVSLREAVAYATLGGLATPVTFDASLAGGTIPLAGSSLWLDADIQIDASTVGGITLDAGGQSRVVTVPSGGSVDILALILTGGSADDGGGIYSYGTLTLTNSTLAGNSARDGGGIYNHNSGTLTLTNSTLAGNSASDDGGGIYNDGTLTLTNSTLTGNSASDNGGGIYTYGGTLTLTNSTLTGNSASDDGGGIYSYGTLTLTNSTLAGNSASDDGGGIYNDGTLTLTNSTLTGNSASGGGGIYNYSGTLTLTNSTLAGNSTSDYDGGGIYNYYGTLTLTNSTLTGNSASDDGGGIYIGSNYGTGILNNVIVAGNTASTGPDIYRSRGTLTGSHNLVGNGSGQSTLVDGVDGNLVGTPELPIDPRFMRNPSDGGDGWGDYPATTSIDESANDDYGDLHIGFDSPAFGAGDVDLLPPDLLDLDGDGDTAEPIPFDLDGKPRIQGGIVSMGAYAAYPELGGVTMAEDTGSSPDDGVTADSTPTFSWNPATEPDFWKYQYRLDTGAWTDTGDTANPMVTVSPADGAHTFRVRSMATAGNVSQASETFDFTIDTHRPSAPAGVSVDEDSGASAGDLITGDTTPRVSWPAVSDLTSIWRYEYQVGGGGWTQVTDTWIDLSLTDGPHTFDVRGVDHAGNEGTARSAAIVVDTQPPSVLSHEPSGTMHEAAGYLDVIFDQEIDPATLQPSALELYYEGTLVADPDFDVTHQGGGVYRIAFTPQMQNGSFRLVIPASVADVAGSPMGTAYDATFEQAVVDLIAVSTTPAETDVRYGQTVQVSWTVQNDPAAGEATGSWWDAVYLSTDQMLDDDDISLGSWLRQGPLQADTTYTGNVPVTLPLDPSYTQGEKYLIVDVDYDGDLHELDETNNKAVSAVLNVNLPPMPDLSVGAVGATGSLIAGQQATVLWETTNVGDADASGAWREYIYVSPDPAVGDDLYLGFVEFDGTIPAGEAVTRSAELTIPQTFAQTGTVYLVVATDTTDQIVESDESNNADVSASSHTIADSLAISASATEVWETAGNNALRFVITRSGSTQDLLEVELESSDETEVVVPTTVTIAQGQHGMAFFAELSDDTIVDPSQVVTVTATATDFLSDSVQVGILDNDTPTLAIELDPTSMNEGDTASCTISRSLGMDDDPSYMTEDPLTVTLRDVSGGQYTLPETVEIPAGALVSAPFDVTATQDEVPELETTFRIEATAAGYIRGSVGVTLIDDDLPNLEIIPARAEVSEGAGATALTVMVRRAEATGRSLRVRLTSSDETAAVVEPEVVIPAGETEANFMIGAVDDDFFDGTQPVVVSAVGVIPSCDCEVPSHGGAATADILVLDDDGPTLKVQFDPELVREGITQAAMLTISRNVDPVGELLVTLTSSDTDGTELVVPEEVTIFDGEASVSVPVKSLEDNVNDGNQTVNMTASAAGFVQGLGSIVVSDVDLPDLQIVSVQGPAEVSTEALFNISYRMENLGFAEAVGSNADPDNGFLGSWTQRVFLSSDPFVGNDVLVGQYVFQGTMPVGSQWGSERTVPAWAPTAPGDYYLVVQTDVTNKATEGLETNNTAISAEPVAVMPAYSAHVETELEQGAVGLSLSEITPVLMTGYAMNRVGEPAQYVPVAIHIIVRNTERVIAAVTDQSGNFSTTWQPLPGEGGRYTIGACHPGLDTATVQDEFVLMGMKVVPTSRSVYVVESQTKSTSFTIHNLADLPLTGLSLTLDAVPANLDITTTDLDGVTIPALGSIPLDVSVHAIDATYTSGSFTMRIDTTEGAAVQMPVHVRIEPLVPRLSATPGSLGGGMLRSSERVVEFEITNTGGLESGPIEVRLPDADWIFLATADEMPSLEPGESSMVSLVLRPPPNMVLGKHSGHVTLNFTGSHLRVPFSFRALSDQQGDLEIRAVDEHFFFTEAKPALAGAHVRVTDALGGEEVFEGTTDASGLVSILDLREGYYQIVIRAEKHETYNKTLLVEADQTNTVRAFLPLQTVRATWTVVETEVEDRYEIVIETVFEANVPAPVVTVSPGQMDLSPLTAPGQMMQVNFTIENHGLIQAEETKIAFGDHPMYDISPLVEDIGILPAKSSVTVPVIITRLEYDDSSVASAELEPANGASCSIPGGVSYVYYCDGQNLRGIPITVGGIDADCGGGTSGPWTGWSGGGGWTGSGGGGGWTGSGGGGGSGGPGTVYTATPATSADTCDPCINELISSLVCWVPWGCAVGGAVGAAAGELEDYVTGRNGNTLQGGVEGALRSCLIGMIPGYGTAINCIIAGGSLLGCLLGNAVGGVPGGPGGPPPSPGGEITPSDSDHGGLADFTWGGESILPKEIPYLNFDLLDLSWAGDVEEVATTYLKGMGWGLTALEPLAYVFGSSSWMYDFSHDPLLEAVTTFLDTTYTTTEEGYYISTDEQAEIISTAVGYEMPQDVFETMIARWNRTMQYWDSGWYTTADVPVGNSTDFIDAEKLHNKYRYGQQAMTEVQDAGYADPTVAVDTSHQILEDVIDEITGAGVCATVKLQIKQEAVITRDGFEATLELENSTAGPLENVSVDVIITNQQGQIITDLFGIHDPEVVGFTPANSPWTLPAQSTGVANWLIVPTTDVAPDGPIVVFIGATLQYTDLGREVTMPLEAVPITVLPQPELELKYFHQRDVFSDDPWTEEAEPAQPFELAVMVHNFGNGEARDLDITSAQPTIIENEQGLLINFKIIGSQVDGQSMTPSLTTTFGTIPPGATSIGRWFLTSTLQGLFVDYNATFRHIDGLGDERLSLIKSVEIHEMIQSVYAYGPFDDGQGDFLTNEVVDAQDLPDTLHLSDGTVVDVSLADEEQATVAGALSPTNFEVTLTAQMPEGWSYLRLTDRDPAAGAYKLVSVIRGDGTVLPTENFWQTNRRFIGVGQRPKYEDSLHLFDHNGTGSQVSYTLTYVSLDQSGPRIDELAGPTGVVEEDIDEVTVTFSEILKAGTFNWMDMTLTRDGGGNLLDETVAIEDLGAGVYRVNGLSPWTDQPGVYRLTVNASGVHDVFSNVGSGSKSTEWTRVTTGPWTQSITGADPFARAPVDVLQIAFSEAVDATTLDLDDVMLLRDGVEVALTGASEFFAEVSPDIFEVRGLADKTGADGEYAFTMDASGIADTGGNLGFGTTTLEWTMDTTAPTVVNVDIVAASPASAITLLFEEPIVVSMTAEVTATVDGASLNTDSVTIAVDPEDDRRIRIEGLLPLQQFAGLFRDGDYALTFDLTDLTDRAGNPGAGSAEALWTVDTTAPEASSDLAVTPDNGHSNVDGVTDTTEVTLTGTLAEEGLAVSIFSEPTGGVNLGEADVTGMSFSIDLSLLDGWNNLRVSASDAEGNISASFFDVFCDITNLTIIDTSWLPEDSTPDPVTEVQITFSAQIAPSTLTPDVLTLTGAGEDLALDGVTIEPMAGPQNTYRLSNLPTASSVYGAYALTIDLRQVEKTSSGRTGAAPHVLEWSVMPIDKTAPKVTSVVVQNGETAAEAVERIDVNFSEAMQLAGMVADGSVAAAVLLARVDDNSEVLAHVPLLPGEFSVDGTSTMLTYHFSGGAGGPGGVYVLQLRPEYFLDQAGNTLDGEGLQIYDIGMVHFAGETLIEADGTQIDVHEYSVPALAEMTGDAQPDLLVGEKTADVDGRVSIYRNTGSGFTFESYALDDATGNPLTVPAGGCLGVSVRGMDWNDDGSTDLLLGQSDGAVKIALNAGDFSGVRFLTPDPVLAGAESLPIDVGDRAVVEVVDLDRDGSFDLVVGAKDGKVRWYRNTGSAGSPSFASSSSFLTLRNGAEIEVPSGRSAPAIADVTGDGRADLLCGNTAGQLWLYANVGSKASPAYLAGVQVTAGGEEIDLDGDPRSRVFVGDANDDGRPDLLVGSRDGLVRMYAAQAAADAAEAEFLIVSVDGPTSLEVGEVGEWTVVPFDALTTNQWDFGDGATFNDEETVSHAYDVDGNYELLVTVTTGGLTASVTKPITVTTPVPTTIGDRVWLDANADGIQNDGETGFEGVVVTLYREGDRFVADTSTDAEGLYRFDEPDVAPGLSYFLEFTHAAGYGFSPRYQGGNDSLDSDADPETRRTATFTAVVGENLNWDAGLVELGSIGGIVWEDTDGDKEKDDEENVLPGRVVYLDTIENGVKDDGEPERETDAEGRYLFENLRPGSYTVRDVLADGWMPTHPDEAGASELTQPTLSEGPSPELFLPGEPVSGDDFTPATDLVNLDDFRADPRFANLDGSAFSVVVIDTGIDPDHPFFGPDNDGDGVADRIVFQYDFADDDADASAVSAHGSHVSSIIASEDATYGGIVPGADLIHLKVFSDSGRGYFTYLERALGWVYEHAAEYNIAAVNLSLGDTQNWTTAGGHYGLADELASLAALDVIVVSAAGNHFGYFDSQVGVAYPAADPNSLAVGAVWDSDRGGPWSFGESGADFTTDADRITGFSQRHDALLDVFAPGALITGANAAGGVTTMRGTSMAAPHVTGAAVLAQQVSLQRLGRPLTPSEFRDLLSTNNTSIFDGDDEDDSVTNTEAFYGRLDIHALADAVWSYEPSDSGGGGDSGGDDGDGDVGSLNGVPFAYSIELAPGQHRLDVDFGTRPDETPPELTVPVDVTLEAPAVTSPDNTGEASATDNWDSSPEVTYSDSVQDAPYVQTVITRTWTATDDAGNSASAVQVITVQDTTPPELTVPADVTIGVGQSTDPADTGEASATDNWDPSPQIIYSDVGEEIITRTWTATDRAGNVASADQLITVLDTGEPVAAAAADPVLAACGQDITFDGSASTHTNPDGQIVLFEWDFESDGTYDWSSPTNSTTTHGYPSFGTYAATLRVTDSDGKTDTDPVVVEVTLGDLPPVADPGGPYTVGEGGMVALDASASSDTLQTDNTTLTYHWDFNYDELTFDTDAMGMSPDFSAVAIDGPVTRTVGLRVTNDDGVSHLATTTVDVTNLAPTATITGAPTAGPEGVEVVLRGSMTDPAPADTAAGFSYAWNVTKNGAAHESGSGDAFHFTPNDDGGYQVTFIGTDKDGGVSDPATATIEISDVAPTIIVEGANTVAEGSDYTLTLGAISDPGIDTVTQWTVHWGDGLSDTYAAGGERTHVYATDGAYTLTVELLDEDGNHAGAGSLNLTVNPAGPEATDVGQVDFLRIPTVDPSASDLYYALETTHLGFLTIEADGESSDVATLALYDKNWSQPPLATASMIDGVGRLDWEVEPAEVYGLLVTGTASSVDLTLANLVRREGATVTVSGTNGDDTFEFNAAASRDVTINGVRYHFDDAEAETVTFDGGDGYDMVILEDSPGDDTITAEAKHAVFANSDQTPGFTVTTDAVEELHAYARAGGHDKAFFHDSDGNDKFKSEPAEDYAKMYGGRMYNRVKFFDTVEAFSTGEKDLARLFDTRGDDVFEGQQDVSWLRTGVFDVGVHNFRRVIAHGNQGGHDVATLNDSALNDEVHLKGHKSEMFDQITDGDVYKITARRFDTVHADGSQGAGDDKVKMWDTSHDNRVEADANWARLLAQKDQLETLYDILAFEFVKVRASSGGNDTTNVTQPLDFDLLFEDGWEQ